MWHNIFAHALYFCDSGEQALVINLDVRELYDHFLNPLRPVVAEKTGIRPENIVFATTHNHANPDVGASTVENCIRWKEELGYPAIIRAAVAAVADAKPVTKMEGGSAISEKINFVRRYQLEEATGVYAVFLQGACGNTNYSTCIKSEKHLKKETYQEVGVSLAATARQALVNAKEMSFDLCQTVEKLFSTA